MFRRSAEEMRVVILAPIGRDAALLAQTLNASDIAVAVATDATALLALMMEGAGAAIIADEALPPVAIQAAATWLSTLPPWSDPPFIVLTSSGIPSRQTHQRARELQALGNLTLIERPVRPDTIRLAARSALRARMRQYEVRSRQEALIQANADLEQFAHSASHDLREPLRGIGISCDLLARDYKKVFDERAGELLRLIRGGVTRMDWLLTDLLAYAHASSITEEELPAVSALRAVEAALENLDPAIQESCATITIGELPEIRVRESHLAQVFQNLLGNAIKYRRDGQAPAIEVSARQADGYWYFTIADNGIGIAKEYQGVVFGIFKRLHVHGKYPGTGMGLAICKRIVERYGGTIWVESEPGQGSRFSFRIPARIGAQEHDGDGH
jgi:signal transduction histidine kinase